MDTISIRDLPTAAVARFWDKVPIGMPSECWEWQGSRLPKGYGHLKVTVAPGVHQDAYAHRLAAQFRYGDAPSGALVLHSCDNPPCCNPAHLRFGTHQDNVNDRGARGRTRSGTYGAWWGNNKLTPEEVIEIRRLYQSGQFSHRQLAKKFGVRHGTIGAILRNEHWKAV